MAVVAVYDTARSIHHKRERDRLANQCESIRRGREKLIDERGRRALEIDRLEEQLKRVKAEKPRLRATESALDIVCGARHRSGGYHSRWIGTTHLPAG